ncbi:hypothetical protein PIB30_031532 [Stylosanthes scabra]|uniref:Uncharacterized protein n=1 Tax=Stylosanthes scabra TaxID=79078 RepID=A0ABU6ZAM7_9FABA|nr:hypothetical protein [Stylosanthes scabra]
MADLSAITMKNTNPNVGVEETFVVLEASEIRRRASLVATIFWKFWNHYNLQIFEGVAGTPGSSIGYEPSAALSKRPKTTHTKTDELWAITQGQGADIGNLADGGSLECKHLLRLEDSGEIMRARTEWRPKSVNNVGAMNQVLSGEN